MLDTHELGRRAGQLKRVQRSAPAPAGLRLELVGVPEGAGIDLDLRCESVVEGVLVSGTARVQVQGDCARCLEPLVDEVVVDLQELYVFDPAEAEEGGGALEGELIDLLPLVRDAVVLALPLAPRCRPDCPGLCPQCGARLADEPGHGHEQPDLRWAALVGLTGLTETTEHDAAAAARRGGPTEES